MKIPSSETWAYLAGIIDGEGNISIVKGNIKRPNFYYSGYVQVGNTDTRLVYWLEANFGGRVCHESRAKVNSKLKWYWTLKDCSSLLKGVMQYLVLKRAQAELVLEFRKTVKPNTGKRGRFYKSPPELIRKREELWLKCRVLNKRGVN